MSALRISLSSIAVAVTSTLFGSVVQGAVRQWDGGAGTLSWQDAANWSNDVKPVAGDTAAFTDSGLGGASNVTIQSAGTDTVESLQFGTAATPLTKQLNFSAGGTLVLRTTASDNQVVNGTANSTNDITIARQIILGGFEPAFGQSLPALNFHHDGAGTMSFTGEVREGSTDPFDGGFRANQTIRKTGSGTIVFSGIVNYGGSTIVDEGTLVLTASKSRAVHAIVNGGTFGSGGVETIDVGAAGRLAPGMPGAPIGFFSAASYVQLDGTLAVDIDGIGSGSSDLLSTAELGIGPTASLDITQLTPADDPVYILAHGLLVPISGTFASNRITGMPAGYELNYHYGPNQDQVALVRVPEPTVLLQLVALSAIVSLRPRR